MANVTGGNTTSERSFSGRRLFRNAAVVSIVCGLAIVLVLSMPVGSELLFEKLQIYPPLAPSALTEESADEPAAIVVLAAGRRRAPEFGGDAEHETVDGLTLERLRYGAYLARKTNLPVLVSGGLGRLDHAPLAELMAETLEADYDLHAKWLESKSATTAENAIFSSGILKQAGITHIFLVTHAWHMKRAVAAFAANGMQVTPAPTGFYLYPPEESLRAYIPNMGTFRMSGYAIHELLGSVWYALRYGY